MKTYHQISYLENILRDGKRVLLFYREYHQYVLSITDRVENIMINLLIVIISKRFLENGLVLKIFNQ